MPPWAKYAVALMTAWIQRTSRFIAILALTIGAVLNVPPARADDPAADSSPKVPSTAASATAAAPDFEHEVRPLFVAHCTKCHGPEKQESDLRLDLQVAASKGGINGKIIEPGKPDESPLLARLITADKDERMPPEGDPLSIEQIDVIRRWIVAGAIWPADAPVAAKRDWREHWAFKAPQMPAVPEVRSAGWPRNEIDRFVLHRLEREPITPSPEADRTTLVRRLYLDLLGLPPSPAEVDEYVMDNRPDAYERLVERLLASPHYGERWGRHWLDAARYADSDGYEKDKSRQVWFYRDWVVDAFNRDLPYDRFVIEQLAGDLLPGATQQQLVATGFLRNSMLNEEGAIDPEQFRMEAMFDRMDAVGKSVLGLTIQCAQCHTHKYDPLTHEDYYRIFAFLNNDHESQRVVYAPDDLAKIGDLTARLREIDSKLRETTPDWAERMAGWEETARAQPVWEALQLKFFGDNSQRYFFYDDKSVRAEGYAPTKSTPVFQGATNQTEIRAFQLELLTDPNLPAGGPGRSYKGLGALTEFKVKAINAKDSNQNRWATITRATADFSNAERALDPEFDDRSKRTRITGSVALAIDGKDETAWGFDAGPGRRNVPRKAVFVASENLAYAEGTILEFHLVQNHGGWNSDDHQNQNLGRYRLSVCGDADAVADPLPAAARAVLNLPREQRGEDQTATLFSAFRAIDSQFKAANDAAEAVWAQWPAGATALTLQTRETPRPTAMLNRGDYLKPVRTVEPGTPAFLHPLADSEAPKTRLTFAEWLVDRRSPTTARVFVNRVWQAYFGTGLVSTPEDFGMQSQAPSHPELLDFLACRFMDHGWSVKDLHRSIVSSATYRQASTTTPEQLARDPYNRLLGRGTRLRVEGEVVRDIALAASGLLDRKVGGPSVFAPAPSFLFQPPSSYGPFNWNEATGTERYRRALYTFRRRSTPYPALQNFDVPNADFSCVCRTRSNTPLQALTTLNETVYVECARALGVRLLKEGGPTAEERLQFGFRLCAARQPTSAELEVLARYLANQQQRIEAGELNAGEVTATIGVSTEPNAAAGPAIDVKQWAAYTLVSRVLLNLDETINKE